MAHRRLALEHLQRICGIIPVLKGGRGCKFSRSIQCWVIWVMAHHWLAHKLNTVQHLISPQKIHNIQIISFWTNDGLQDSCSCCAEVVASGLFKWYTVYENVLDCHGCILTEWTDRRSVVLVWIHQITMSDVRVANSESVHDYLLPPTEWTGMPWGEVVFDLPKFRWVSMALSWEISSAKELWTNGSVIILVINGNELGVVLWSFFSFDVGPLIAMDANMAGNPAYFNVGVFVLKFVELVKDLSDNRVIVSIL